MCVENNARGNTRRGTNTVANAEINVTTASAKFADINFAINEVPHRETTHGGGND